MPNLLAGETSPYLLQHADNPVHWHPWGPQALALAKEQGRPILLSVGYSACHWCHVMAHESFENEATAALMNRLFVNIKVDREERPDIDQIYQQAHQILTRQGGGWPLTIFLDPDGTPFHSGTYYPDEARYGRPAFRDLLESVAAAWQDKRAAIEQQNQAVREALARRLPLPPEAAGATEATALGALSGPVQQAARAWCQQHYDEEHGGFGGAPKFPRPTDLAWLLERGVAEGDSDARTMALSTLGCMAAGGVYDQIGGGFFRYSVDERWEIPHFEKMLSDNGQLLALYAEAAALEGEPVFGRVVEDTAEWLMREMQLPEGGYASSLDADSEGEEGRFYVWSPEAVRAALTPLEWDLASAHFNLMDGANFEARHWHLRQERSPERLSRSLNQPQQAIADILHTVRGKLLAERDKRERPGRDDKVLGSWNALAITGMVRAAGVAGRADWLGSARRALAFVQRHLWVAPQAGAASRLLATCKDGRAHLDAYLDDHAFLLEALLALLQADFRIEDLRFARVLADELLAHFEDREHGGFFFTRHDHEALIHRPKAAQDGALPAGNGVAAWALQRLGHLLGEPRYLRAAERTLAVFAAEVARNPGSAARLLQAAVEHLTPPTLVVIAGSEACAWRDALLRHCLPHTLVLAPALHKLPPADGSTQAWVCRGVSCEAPVATLQALAAGLGLQADA